MLHGFGFASALAEIGLPQSEIPAALASFNIGVEIGQIVFVAAIIGAFWTIREALKMFSLDRINRLNLIQKPVAYAIGSITMLWTIERVGAFWI